MNPRAGTLRHLTVAIAALATLGLLAACGSSSSGGSAATTTAPAAGGAGDLVGAWRLESFPEGPSPAVPVPAGAAATMTFAADGAFSGNTGCNILNGTWKIDGATLTLVPGPMTMRACEDLVVQAQEQALVNGLPEVTAYTVAGDTLTLLDIGAKPLFRFAAADELTGTSWTVTGVNTGDALVGVELGAGLTVTFEAGGVVSGNDGCNNFKGSWTETGGTLTVTGLASTMMACEPEIATRAGQFTAALQVPTTVEVSGSTVTLRDANGAMQLTLTLA